MTKALRSYNTFLSVSPGSELAFQLKPPHVAAPSAPLCWYAGSGYFENPQLVPSKKGPEYSMPSAVYSNSDQPRIADPEGGTSWSGMYSSADGPMGSVSSDNNLGDQQLSTHQTTNLDHAASASGTNANVDAIEAENAGQGSARGRGLVTKHVATQSRAGQISLGNVPVVTKGNTSLDDRPSQPLDSFSSSAQVNEAPFHVLKRVAPSKMPSA